MNPAVILISDDDDGDYERNMNEELDVVLISSDEDDDYERNLKEQKNVVLISDDDNGDELVVNDVEKADEEVGFDNCNYAVDCLHQGNNDLPKPSLKECKLYLRKYGMRLSGSKEDYIQRMKEHVRLIDRRGVSLYPRSLFSINCTGDVCKGDVVMFKQNIYNSQRKSVGRRTVAGRIVKESYSESKQQYTFSVEVLWSEPSEKLNPLSILPVKGCNLFKFGTFRQPWTCEAERSKVLGEKHSRGNAARHKRKLKQTEFASNNNKGVERQKVSYKGPFQSKLPTQIDKTNPRRQCADSVEESTSTNEKKAVTVRFQKTKLKRLKDRRVNLLYPRSSFSINCTGDVCKGDVVLFKQKQSNKRGERAGKIITVSGKIVKESYGASRQQHTFTIEVLWTKHSMNPLSLSTLSVRGRNLYRFGTFRQPWNNEAERLEVLEEKHKRGEAARHKIKLRLAQIASTKDRRVNLLYPRSSFSINCTGDVCKGDVVLFKQKQSNKRGERVGKIITVAGKIVKESYGALRQQHTFTIEVLWTKHSMNPLSLSTLLVRGRNLYRFGTFRQPWKNEAERLEVLEEKHKRGEAARHKRKLRLAQIASTNDKGGKGQKVSYRGSSRSKQTTRLVKRKFSKRWSAALAMPQKRKSTQLSHHPNSNQSLIKQPTQTDKKKFSKRQGSSLVKESKAAHKRKAVQFQRTEFNRSTQPTFHQEPNPNRSMYSDHNLQEASSSFPYYPNLNPNRFMYSDHNLQEASSSFPYYPNLNPNRFMYSDHHLQEASSFFPYDPSLSLWSLGNNGQWGPSNVFYQPPGQYRYSYEQPDL